MKIAIARNRLSLPTLIRRAFHALRPPARFIAEM